MCCSTLPLSDPRRLKLVYVRAAERKAAQIHSLGWESAAGPLDGLVQSRTS